MADPTWRVELWDDLVAAGGTRLAVLPVLSGSMTRTIDNNDSLSLEAWLEAEWLQHATLRRVLRLSRPAAAPTEVYEWRLADLRRGRGRGEDQTVGLKAVAPLTDLTFAGVIVDRSTAGQVWYNLGGVGLTPEQYIDAYVVPTMVANGSTYIEVGTVSDTTPVDLAWDRWTPRQLTEELIARSNGELEYTMAGSTAYTLNIWAARGSTVPARLFEIGRNMRMLRWRRQLEHVRSVVVPGGAVVPGAVEAASIAYAAWKVDVVSGGTGGGTVTLADISSGDGPVAFNDQLSTHWMLTPDAGLLAISSASTGHVLRTTDSLATLTSGQRVEFRASSGGAHLTELANPALAATSGIGRVVMVYEDQQFRGEHNLVRNGLWTEWDQTYGYYCTATSSGSTGTTVVVRNLPTSGLTIKAGDVLHRGTGNKGYFRQIQVTANVTAATSGYATLTLALATTFQANENCWVYLMGSSRQPTAWTLGSSDGYPAAAVQRRDSTLQTAITGLACTGGSSVGTPYVSVAGFSTDDVVQAGDVLLFTSTGTRVRVMGNTVPSSSGVAKIGVAGSVFVGINSTDGAGITLERPTLSQDAGRYYAALQMQDGDPSIVSNQPYIEGPQWTVLYDETLPTLQMQAALSYHSLSSQDITAASTINSPLKVVLWDVNSSAALMTVDDADLAMAAREVQERLLAATTSLAATTKVAVRVYPPRIDSMTQAYSPDPWVYVRYVMLTVGSDPLVPPIEGSYGVAAWQRANKKLEEFSADPDVYEVEIDDIAHLPGYTSTDESLMLGGTVRLKDSVLGLDKELRIVQIENNLVDARHAKVVLAKRPTLVTETLARQKPQSRISVSIDISGTTSTSGGAGGYGGVGTGTPISSDPDVRTTVSQVVLSSPNEMVAKQPGTVRAVPNSTGGTTKKVYPKYS